MSILHSLKKIWAGSEEERERAPEALPFPQPQAPEEPQPSQPAPPEPADQAELLPLPQAQTPYDQQIMDQRADYAALTDKISKVYNALRGQAAFESPAIDELLLLCNQAIALRRQLLPCLAEGDWIRPHGEAYKRLAMALEKRGDFQGAAEICLMALRDGAVNDGSQSGMAGRMARMLKKGRAAPTPEMKQYLQKKRPAPQQKPLAKAAGGES